MRHLLRAAFSLSIVVLPLSAQAPEQVSVSRWWREDVTGYVVDMPGYCARVGDGGLQLTVGADPVAGGGAQLHLRAERIARGERLLWQRDGGVAATVTGSRVEHLLTAGVSETFDVRRSGVELSYVFDRRPEGEGDLVVRCRLATAAAPGHVSSVGVAFTAAGGQGLAIGAVTGIDAAGRTERGLLRLDGEMLELSLPAAFVATASYPLVLDPLIGSPSVLASAAVDDVLPSLAFDETTQRYLMCWAAVTSFSSVEIRGQFLTATGALSGAPFTLTTSSLGVISPVVANINDRDSFVCVWGEDVGPTYVLHWRVVSASTGAVTASGTFGSDVQGFAVGGDSRTPLFGTADAALISYSTFNRIDAAVVHVASSGSATVNSVGTLFTFVGGTSRVSAVSNQAGVVGRWLVVATNGPVAPLSFALVTSSGTVCHTGSFAGVTGWGCTVATPNGNDFLIAWEDAAAPFAVRLRRLSYPSTCAGVSPGFGPIYSASPAADLSPRLTFARDRYLLAWIDGNPARVAMRTIALDPGQYMGPIETPSPASGGAVESVAIASRWAGGDIASDEALVVWSNGAISGHRAEATGTGAVLGLGGGCGITGLNDFATYSGTPLVGTSFSIELAAPTAPVLGLIVGFSASPFACGPCTIVPAIDIALATAGPVPVNVPLNPDLVGASLYTQWVQWRPSGCALLPDFGFSNALRFVLSE